MTPIRKLNEIKKILMSDELCAEGMVSEISTIVFNCKTTKEEN